MSACLARCEGTQGELPIGADGSGMIVPIGAAMPMTPSVALGLGGVALAGSHDFVQPAPQTFLASKSLFLLLQRQCTPVPGLLRFPVKLGRICMIREIGERKARRRHA